MNEFEPGFRLSDLYGVIRRRLPLIILAVIAGAVAASAFLVTQTTEFQATSTVVVQPITSTLNLDPATTPRSGGQLVPTFAEFVRSDRVATEVKKRLELEESVDKLVSRVEVSNAEGSMRVDIAFTAEDQADAKAGADAFAKVFLEQRQADADASVNRTREKLETQRNAVQEKLTQDTFTLGTANPTSGQFAQATVAVETGSRQLESLNEQIDSLLTIDTTPGQITRAAVIPEQAAGVPTAVIVAGIVAFFALGGLAVALIWDRLDPRVTSQADIERISPDTSVDILPLGSSTQEAASRGSPRAAALNRLVFRLATPGATETPRAILLAGTGDRAPTELAAEINQAFAAAGARSFLVSTVPTVRKGRHAGKLTTQSLRPILDGKVPLADVVGNGHGSVVLCPEDAADAEATINPKSIEQLLGKAKAEGFHVVLFAGPTPARHSRTVGVAREVASVVVAADPRSTRAGVRDAVAAMVDADRPPSDVVVA